MGAEEAGRGRNENVVNNSHMERLKTVVKNNHEVK